MTGSARRLYPSSTSHTASTAPTWCWLAQPVGAVALQDTPPPPWSSRRGARHADHLPGLAALLALSPGFPIPGILAEALAEPGPGGRAMGDIAGLIRSHAGGNDKARHSVEARARQRVPPHPYGWTML